MLTDLKIRQAKARESDYKLPDSGGLHLFVTKKGFKSWRLKYRFAGKEKLLVLGSYPDVSLAEARERRDEAKRILREHRDPAVEAQKLADEVDAHIDEYMEGDLLIETYRAGQRTGSFRPTGFHKGEGDPVTDLRLRWIQEADFVLLSGAARPIALPAANAKVAIAQYIAACAVLVPH